MTTHFFSRLAQSSLHSIALLGLLASIAACGGSTSPAVVTTDAGGSDGASSDVGGSDVGGSDAGDPAQTAACTASSTATCSEQQKCNALAFANTWPDTATCVSRLTASCLASLAAPSTGASTATVNACASARPGESCDDYWNNNPPAACKAPIGKLADGSKCAFNGQCSGSFCQISKNAACGVCGAPAKAGESCATFGCDYGLSCVTKTQLCQKLGASGADCDATMPCDRGLSCVGASATAKGKCQAAVATVGGTCDPRQQTAPGCDRSASLWCNATTKQCSTITSVATGAACGELPSGDLADCAAGGFCRLTAGTKAGTCVAFAPDGAACDPSATTGPECQSPARCVGSGTTGTCTLPGATACGG